MKRSQWWLLSTIVTFIFTLILVQLWIRMNEYTIEPPQLIDDQAVEHFLKENWEKHHDNTEEMVKVKTGIFIQSLDFFNSTEVSLTGYIWQHYTDGIHDAIKPAPGEVGFILPEQVNSGSDITPREVYRYRTGDDEVIGWYFEATLCQPFKYDTYPFDHKTVWVRIWPKKFFGNIVLVPDFQAYNKTGLKDIFGIKKDIVLGTWERRNTFFDYKLSEYDTNFGISRYIGQNGFPELHYNFVVKRKFDNAFIVHLLPLLLVAALLFASMLTVSVKDRLTEKMGFSTSGFIGACSALFFVVLLAHIQLREQFASTTIVYIEYFYFLIYALLVLATINTFLFSIHADRWSNIIVYEDNLFAKVLYWPFLLGCMILITLHFL
jgi:hypothetical protein